MADPVAAKRARPEASTHHERYPQRLHSHLAAAADAIEAIETPTLPPGDPDTPGDLVAAYGGNGEARGGEDE